MLHRISSILVARFLLDLRELHARIAGATSEDETGLSTLSFVSRPDLLTESDAPSIVRDFEDPSTNRLSVE